MQKKVIHFHFSSTIKNNFYRYNLINQAIDLLDIGIILYMILFLMNYNIIIVLLECKCTFISLQFILKQIFFQIAN